LTDIPKGIIFIRQGRQAPHNTKGNNMKKIDPSRVLCEMDVIIGNGTGHHKLIKGKAYRLATLKADMRLTASQIKKFFRPLLTTAK
jgi:hypothetical protein